MALQWALFGLVCLATAWLGQSHFEEVILPDKEQNGAQLGLSSRAKQHLLACWSTTYYYYTIYTLYHYTSLCITQYIHIMVYKKTSFEVEFNDRVNYILILAHGFYKKKFDNIWQCTNRCLLECLIFDSTKIFL